MLTKERKKQQHANKKTNTNHINGSEKIHERRG